MNKDFSQLIKQTGSGKQIPVMDLIRDRNQAVLMSKMVPGRLAANLDDKGNRAPIAPNISNLQATSQKTAQSISDAKTVMRMLPEIELSAQILISCILAPKDLMTTELRYMAPEDTLPSDVAALMIKRLTAYFERDYKIKPKLASILHDALFETGSYALAVIPENSLDEVINGQNITLESLSSLVDRKGNITNRGFLGNVKIEKTELTTNGLSLEAFRSSNTNSIKNYNPVSEELGITVVDNYDVLKFPEIAAIRRRSSTREKIGSSAMESLYSVNIDVTDKQITDAMYRSRSAGGTKHIVEIKSQDRLSRKTVGNPLVMKLPSESVIPVFIPGTPDEHVGFYVMIDNEGNPVSLVDDMDYYGMIGNKLSGNGGDKFASSMINKVRGEMGDFSNYSNMRLVDETVRIYSEMAENDLLARMRNGSLGDSVRVSKNAEFYRIMLARRLQGQQTQLLFVPSELMTYIAFQHNTDGTGRSLLDDTKIINSMRIVLMFSNVMAATRNAIGRTNVEFKLDEADPNPQKTLEKLIHEFLQNRQNGFPIANNNPAEVADYLSRAGFVFTFANHPGMPDVSMDVSETNSNYVKPDTELDEDLRRRSIMHYGLTPEMVDGGSDVEFAQTLIQGNLLLSKRVLNLQEDFTPQLADHLRKVACNSEKLIDELRAILVENSDKIVKRLEGNDSTIFTEDEMKLGAEYILGRILNDFMNNFDVALPAPTTATLTNQMEAFNAYGEAIDKAIDVYISTDFMTDNTMGELSSNVDEVKAVVKSIYMRRWLSENGVLPELADLITVDDENRPKVDIYEENANHIASLTKSIFFFMQKLQATKDAAQVAADALLTPPEEGSDSSGSDSSPEEGGDGGTGNDDEFNMDDLAAMDAPAASEEPAAEDTPAEDETPKEPDAEKEPEEPKPEE